MMMHLSPREQLLPPNKQRNNSALKSRHYLHGAAPRPRAQAQLYTLAGVSLLDKTACSRAWLRRSWSICCHLHQETTILLGSFSVDALMKPQTWAWKLEALWSQPWFPCLTFWSWSPGKQEETRFTCTGVAPPPPPPPPLLLLLDALTCTQIYTISLTHTHKQTIKVNHFLLTSKLKLSVPRGGVLLECCVLMTASSQGPWNADQARGALLFALQPLATILWYKSFFPSSWPGRFHRVSAGLLILAPFMLGWPGWAQTSGVICAPCHAELILLCCCWVCTVWWYPEP